MSIICAPLTDNYCGRRGQHRVGGERSKIAALPAVEGLIGRLDRDRDHYRDRDRDRDRGRGRWRYRPGRGRVARVAAPRAWRRPHHPWPRQRFRGVGHQPRAAFRVAAAALVLGARHLLDAVGQDRVGIIFEFAQCLGP